MISIIKEVLIKIRIKKINNIYEETEYLIKTKDYDNAGKKLLEAVKFSEKVILLLTYNLLKMHICFLSNNYNICIKIAENCLISINKNTTNDKNTKNYYLHFIYRILYISYVFCNNIKEAEIIFLKLKEISLDQKNIKEYIIETYPLYNGEKLFNLYIDNGYIGNVAEDKLDSIVLKLQKLNNLN